MLFRLGEILSRRKEEFSRDMTREMGKVLKEARGDVQEAIDMAYLMGGEGRRLHGATTPSELPDKFAMAVRSPIGVCAFITPWNFPMAIPAWKATAAVVFQAGIAIGKFQGVMKAQTPIGARTDIANLSGSSEGVV